jgi:hypothetical protein
MRFNVKLFTVSILGAFTAVGQTASPGTSQTNSALVSLARASAGHNSLLYNGSEYVYTSHGKVGTPFFQTDSFVRGSVVYHQIPYHNVLMAYDIEDDVVVIRDFDNKYNITLVSEKLDSFSLLNRNFVKLLKDSSADSPPTGFYELVVAGKAMFYRKAIKQLQASRTEDKMQYTQYDRFYILNNGKYFFVDSRKSLLSALGGNGDEMNRFLRKNNLNFKKRPMETIVVATNQYNQSTSR